VFFYVLPELFGVYFSFAWAVFFGVEVACLVFLR